MSEEQHYLFAVADAIDENDEEKIKEVFSSNPEQLTVFTPFSGGTWLHYAAREANSNIIKLLLDLGFDADVRDKWDGANAVTRAALGRRADNARILLDAGAALDVSSSVRNALFSSIVGRSPEVARLLINRGIDTAIKYTSETMRNMDAVAFAMMQGEHEIARMIALHNARGDEAAAQTAMDKGSRIAEENTEPVPEGESIRPS